MKHFLKITIIVFLSIGFIATVQSCKKPTVPVVTTVSVSAITQTSATSGGNVTDDGGEEVTARGVCWGTIQNPTTSSSKTSDGAGIGTFTSSLPGLAANTRYYVSAYATNSEGTSYGNAVSFTTNPILLATLTTIDVTSIASSTAVSGGNISEDGGAPITERGICWETTKNPTTANNKVASGTGTGSFIANLTQLQPGTQYHVRAYATNSAGTAYGNDLNFTSATSIPPIGNQIIADHTIVDRFDNIPPAYIAEVKKMRLVVPGESHSAGYRTGLLNLETAYPTYDVSVKEWGTPEAYTTSNLRVSNATWGDYDNSTGWIYSYGEEDWFTSALAISRTKAGITYCNSNSLTISAFGFGWCWDPYISVTNYIPATQEYINYCTANGISTKVFFTTGPVDGVNASGEVGYNKSVFYESIRTYVEADVSRILFDYADILCYNDDGTTNSTTWSGHTYPIITSTNLIPTEAAFHISNAGAIRLAKAMWWMLARMAGWDGN